MTNSYNVTIPADLAKLGFKNNTISAVYAGIAYPWDKKTPKQHYRVTIPGISVQFDYYCKTEPKYPGYDRRGIYVKPASHEKIGFNESDALDFLGCIFGDVDFGNMSFYDFCFELGYDEDSRKALATWESCSKTGRDLRQQFNSSQQAAILEYLREAGY